MGNGWGYFQISRAIIQLVVVFMVDHFAFAQPSPERLFRNQPVFIGIAPRIGHVVVDADTDEHVAG